MNIAPTPPYEYHVGGSLPSDAPSYIKRQADQDLYEGLISKEFCYVLNSRQMGKSSLWIQTMKKLQSENIACAAIDLTKIGSQIVTQEQWYAGIVRILMSSFALVEKFNLRSWWRERDHLSPVQRLSEFIEEILLTEVTQEIVIFIDEIDSVLSLNFSNDDFFALIRFCYNQRVVKPLYKKLTFCLLGVATPSDLIQDKKRTPFNIGRAIELKGFKLHESLPLAEGLAVKFSNPQLVLQNILDWTGGQPFLTQKLCKLIQVCDNTLNIEDIVQSHMLKSWESQDEPEHLRTIRDRILKNEHRAGRLLGLYQQILQRVEVAADNSLDQIALRLSGLVVEEQGKLRVYNEIYRSVFNQSWIENTLAYLRPYAEAITAWLASNCSDESRLLRGQALQDAQAWAVGKNLSNEDYQFLNAGQTLENREYQNALKLLKFRFSKGKASSLSEFIELCDRYPEEAKDFLYKNEITQWLLGQGRTDLASLSRKIISSYLQESHKGLEIFVRELCKDVGIAPYPIVSVEPNKFDFGEISIGYETKIEFEINKKGRGFVWGHIKVEGRLPGITIPTEINFNKSKKFSIHLDTLAVHPGDYGGYILLELEGIREICKIYLKYTVKIIHVQIEPKQINFGDITYIKNNSAYIQKSFNITCIDKFGRIDGRIKGKASKSLKQIEVKPTFFESRVVDFTITLDTSSIEAGQYKDTIIIETNVGQFEVEVKFNKRIKWEIIGKYSIIYAFTLAIVMYIIRFILNFSIPVNNLWFFSYTEGILSIIKPGVFSRNCIFSINNQQQVIDRINSSSRVIGFILAVSIPLVIPYYRKSVIKSVLSFSLKLWFSLLCLMYFLYNYNSYFQEEFWIGGVLRYIAFIALFIIDLIAYSFTLLSIKQPALGWLLLGALVGVFLGSFQGIKKIKQYSYISKLGGFFFITITTIIFASFLAINLIQDTCH